MRSLLYLNKFFYKYRLRFLLGIVFIFLSNLFAIIPAQLVRKALDSVQHGFEVIEAAPETDKAEILSDVSRALLYFGLLTIAFALMKGIFMFFMRQTIIVMSRYIEYDLKNEIYSHYQDLSLSFYKVNNTGDLMSRISEDVSKVRMYLGPAVMYTINLIMLFIMVLITMLLVNPRLTVITLIPVPVMGILIYYVSSYIQKRSSTVQKKLSGLATLSQEFFSGIRVVQAFNKEKTISDIFSQATDDYRQASLHLVKADALFAPVIFFLTGISTILAVYFGGLDTIQGEITIGTIAEFIMYINLLTWPVASVGWVTSIIQHAAASQARLNEFLQTKPDIKEGEIPLNESVEELQFKDVNFNYKESGIKALKKVSFSIKKGQSIGILGKTGSGKSTIPLLICRNFDPDQGSIIINGSNIKEFTLGSIREKIGYVPQDVFLFSDTIRANIAFSAKKIDADYIESAAEKAAVADSIKAFPDGYDTMIGERGITLSGGQKQRISIARAIAKDPEILIFDDCLSAVDTETEQKILEGLREKSKGRIAFFISHRVSTVMHTDFLIFLEDGVIVETGSPQELFDKKASFYTYYHSQTTKKEHTET